MQLKYHFGAKSLEHLRQLAIDIGWLQELTDKEGNKSLSVSVSGCWDEIGPIYAATGETIETEFGTQDVMAAVTDKDGDVLQHVNFLWNTDCEIDPVDGLPMKWTLLMNRASEYAAKSGEEASSRIANALGSLSVAITYDGKVAEDPKTPARVFA